MSKNILKTTKPNIDNEKLIGILKLFECEIDRLKYIQNLNNSVKSVYN